MRNCDHRSWLSFHGKEQTVFRHASTLSDIVSSLDTPAKKFPSLVVMIGHAGDAPLMTHALPHFRKRDDGQESDGLSLQLDPDTAFSDHPTLIAQDSISKRTTFTPEPIAATCHRHTVRELQWQVSSPAEAINNLRCRLIRPFADLVCLFSTSDDDLQRHVDYMAPWLEQSYSGKCRSMFCPRLLLISAPSEKRSASDVQAQLFKLLQQRLKHPRTDFFSYVSVYIKNGSSQTLKDRIKRESDMARNFRAQNHILLNAIHFDFLFRHACDHFANTRQEPFDMLAASRLHRPVPVGLQTHLAELLTTVDTYEDMTAFVAPFVAGCLAVDNYAYDVPFLNPKEVFAAHYKTICMAAAENRTLKCSSQADASILLLRAGLVSLIERHFLEKSRPYQPNSNRRSSLLNEFRPWLSRVKTYKLCLACMQTVPEHKFPCGHMVCEECFKDLGHFFDTDPHLYELDHCPICKLPCDVTLRVKPVTAGFRVLSIDGGGIRAVIPIQFLRALEQAVGLDMPIQEHFDLSYGTSSGCMVNLALYGRGMSVDETYNLFKQLSMRIFRGRNRMGVGFAAAAHALIASYRNGRFPAGDIDGALFEIFKDATMLDHPYMSSIGARTGFPVVNADTLETCVVTSYNGAARGQNCGDGIEDMTYKVLRSEDALNEIPVKDAARCASAAPWYFTPHKIPYHGTFIDGGLSDNNPSMLALQELRRMAPELRRPDQFVSIGTGSCSARQVAGMDANTDATTSFFFGNNSLQQTFKHYWSENFNGDKKFASMRHMMAITLPDEAGDIDQWLRRFNLPLGEQLPDLADAQAMDGLATTAWTHFTSDPAVQDLAHAILASSFYFELRCMPMYERGFYTCYGHILCRIPVANPAFLALMRKLDSMGACFLVQRRTSRERKSSAVSFDQTGNFSKPVCVRVRSLEDQLDVRLKFLGTRDYHVSASPLSISTLIKLQNLEWKPLLDTDSRSGRPIMKRRPSDCCPRAVKRRCSRKGEDQSHL